MRIEHYYGKVIFPISCDTSSIDKLKTLMSTTSKGKNSLVFRHIPFETHEMRQGIGHLLNDELGTILEVERREILDIGKNHQKMIFHPRSGHEATITFEEVRYVLFKTGVALIEIDFGIDDIELEDLMNITYFMCEVKDNKNFFSYEVTKFNQETKEKTFETHQFTLNELLMKATTYLDHPQNFEGRKLESTSAKPILYSYYLALDTSLDATEKVLNNLAYNYKLSYKANMETRGHRLQSFENSFWLASNNGALNFTLKTEDETTNQFFESTFLSKWNSEYYFLFMNVLHQKYYSLHQLNQAKMISKTGVDYDEMLILKEKNRHLIETITEVKADVFFELPSRIDHVNKVYELMANSMQSKDYLGILNQQLKDLDTIFSSYMARIDEMNALDDCIKSLKNEALWAQLALAATILTFSPTFMSACRQWLAGNAIQVEQVVVSLTFIVTATKAITEIFNKRNTKNQLIKTREAKVKAIKK